MMETGTALIVPMIVSFFLGHQLDKALNFKFPILTILFSLLGMVTGMWTLYKRYSK